MDPLVLARFAWGGIFTVALYYSTRRFFGARLDNKLAHKKEKPLARSLLRVAAYSVVISAANLLAVILSAFQNIIGLNDSVRLTDIGLLFLGGLFFAAQQRKYVRDLDDEIKELKAKAGRKNARSTAQQSSSKRQARWMVRRAGGSRVGNGPKRKASNRTSGPRRPSR